MREQNRYNIKYNCVLLYCGMNPLIREPGIRTFLWRGDIHSTKEGPKIPEPRLKREKTTDKQQYTRQNIENERLKTRTPPKTWGWYNVLQMGKQILLYCGTRRILLY